MASVYEIQLPECQNPLVIGCVYTLGTRHISPVTPRQEFLSLPYHSH